MNADLERIKSIKSFPQLVRYLREELDWKIDDADIDDLTFDYEPEELGIDKETAVKIKQIKQLRPLTTNQPWGIFYLSFEPKRLPIVALRRILRSLVIKKRESANRSQMATWEQNDLLFISSYGEQDNRELTFAHFSDNTGMGDLPTLKVLGWSAGNTVLRLEDTYKTLNEKLHWPEDDADVQAWREQWSSAFKLQYRETVRTSKDLATRLADLAIVIRESVNEVLTIETEKGELRKLYKAFQEALIHDLTEDDFADMYAQTIAYGLLSARISRTSGALVADNLSDLIPNTNPFLKELMQTFLTVGGRKSKIDFDELGINEVVELLRNANMEEVLRDFGSKNPDEDPVIHFYELFLTEYDATKRLERGVFYTPRPVVSFIVRSVDGILRNDFSLADGLADTTTWGEMSSRNKDLVIPAGVSETAPFVQILDPATGTGTFLVEVIDLIYTTMSEKWRLARKSDNEVRELWNEYVPQHLLPRLYGFELMMAPYSIAHMKIGLKLRETGYSFISSERAQIYLTNTLEEAQTVQPYLETMAPALAHEALASNRAKANTPITVIVGNPPYAGHSSNNQNAWIVDKVHDYKRDFPDLQKPGQAKWLQDDYVKFIRYAQLRIELTGAGLVGYITNHRFLENPTFKGLRSRISNTFTSLTFVDLHGSSKRKEKAPDGSKDENVFDIQQGVAISLMVRKPNDSRTVKHSHLFGTRRYKYDFLLRNTLGSQELTLVRPIPPFFLFIPQGPESLFAEYRLGVAISEAMNPYGSPAPGIVTTHDEFAISWSENEAKTKVYDLISTDDESEARELFKLCKQDQWIYEDAKAYLSNEPWEDDTLQILYRPFDLRWTVFNRYVAVHRRKRASHHMIGHPNLALCTTRAVEIERGWEHVFCSAHVIQHHTVSIKEVNYFFPLYLYPTAEESRFGASGVGINLEDSYIERLSSRLGIRFDSEFRGEVGNCFGPENVFSYFYSIFHSVEYRIRYAEFLMSDFPRIPFTSDIELFSQLCACGATLSQLHLLEGVQAPRDWKLKTDGSTLYEIAEVTPGFPKYEDGKVFINKTTWFDGVAEEVWNFHIGGYQVCHKWLKDRKSRTLSPEDIAHYGKITVALRETIRLMSEIDDVIESHGGFPLPGSVETT